LKLLLDSHAVLWAADNPSRLGAAAKAELQNPANELFLSAATIWEIAIKVGIGKLSLSLPYATWMNRAMVDLGIATVLPITVHYAGIQATLPNHHGDPFDRLLVAQSQAENMPLVSSDPVFDQYGVSRIW
jgi:PIN domain nuclease of toxin-antitoxin system